MKYFKNCEGSLAQEQRKYKGLNPRVTLLQKIKTTLYKIQQAKLTSVPKALVPKVTEKYKKRLGKGVIEPSYMAICNLQYLIRKKDKNIYLTKLTTKINAITTKVPLYSEEPICFLQVS